MVFIVGKLYMKKDMVGYRLVDTACQKVHDATTQSCIDNYDKLNIQNYILHNGKLSEKGHEDIRYPKIDYNTKKVSNNKIVILCKNGDNYTVSDGSGKIRDVTFEQIETCERHKIANIKSFPEFSVEPKNTTSDTSNNKSESNFDIRAITAPILMKALHVNSENRILDLISTTTLIPELETMMTGEVPIEHVDEYRSILTKKEAKTEQTEAETEQTEAETEQTEAETEQIKNKTEQTENKTEQNENETEKSYDQNTIFDVLYQSVEDNSQNTESNIDCGEYKLIIEEAVDGRRLVTGIEPKTFRGTVIIPEGITHISEEAFSGTSMHKCVLSNTVEYIGNGAFQNSSLAEIELSSKITAIPHYCFYNCNNLSKIDFKNIESLGNYAFTNTAISEVNLVKGVKQTGIECFRDCVNLHTFTHLPTLVKIRTSSFEGCGSLTDFDFTGVADIEARAFYDSGLEEVILVEPIEYIKTNSFRSPMLHKVVISEGSYKIDGRAFRRGRPKERDFGSIVYTVPANVSNFGTNLFTNQDTVECYHNTSAETAAKMAGSKIVYLDTNEIISNVVLKARMLRKDIAELLSDTITDIYTKEDIDFSYDLDDTGLGHIPLTDEIIKLYSLKVYDSVPNYEEKPKFKVVLDHLRKSSPAFNVLNDPKMAQLMGTISVESNILYDDNVSVVQELTFKDHKFESRNAKLIVVTTGKELRYCCLTNVLTTVYCAMPEAKDVDGLLRVLVKGDKLGSKCLIGGAVYDNIVGKSNQKVNGEAIKVNMYQAISNSAIIVNLDTDNYALILPVNNKILLVKATGRAVTLNDGATSYKSKGCDITEIFDMADSEKVFNYANKRIPTNDKLFKDIAKMSKDQVEKRITSYANIGTTETSAYRKFRKYCCEHGIQRLDDLDLAGLGIMLTLPVVEKKDPAWLDKEAGKNMTSAERDYLDLGNGDYVQQYVTRKKVRMSNKFITGGDREIFVYEVYGTVRGAFGRLGVFASNMSLDNLFLTVSNTGKTSSNPKKVYTDTSTIDVVSTTDLTLIANLYTGTQSNRRNADNSRSQLWLTMYKPNGLYYVAYVENEKSGKASLLIQVGDMEIMGDFTATVNSSKSTGYKLLDNAGYQAIHGITNYGSQSSIYKMLAARKLAIEGVTDVSKYIDIGIPPVVAHLFGVSKYDDSIYDMPEMIEASYADDEDIDFGDDDITIETPNIEHDEIDDIEVSSDELDIDLGDIEMDIDDSYIEQEGIDEDSLRIYKLTQGLQ